MRSARGCRGGFCAKRPARSSAFLLWSARSISRNGDQPAVLVLVLVFVLDVELVLVLLFVPDVELVLVLIQVPSLANKPRALNGNDTEHQKDLMKWLASSVTR